MEDVKTIFGGLVIMLATCLAVGLAMAAMVLPLVILVRIIF